MIDAEAFAMMKAHYIQMGIILLMSTKKMTAQEVHPEIGGQKHH